MVWFLTETVALSTPGLASLNPIAGVRSAMQGRRSGMFWVIDIVPGSDRTMVWHNVQTGGYSSYLAAFPQTRRGVVVLANDADASAERTRRRRARALARRARRAGVEVAAIPLIFPQSIESRSGR